MSDTTKSTNIDINPDVLFQVFSDSNVVIIIWFLAVYFVVYLILNIVRGRDGAKSSISRWIDIVALFCLLIYLGFSYFVKSEEDKKQILSDVYTQFKNYLNSPLSIISVGFFIFTLYVVIYILNVPMDSFGKPITVSIIENGSWIFFVLILLSVSLKYIAGVSVTNAMDDVKDYLKEKAEDATETTAPSNTTAKGGTNANANANATANTTATTKGGSISSTISSIMNSSYNSGNTAASSSSYGNVELDEVFNIGNNMFTYDDAQSVCASFGARLATYDEIESTYNNGGEWCNYGWSDGQSAYFPTQKSTWQKLQKSESSKHSCGRPGVNGGHMINPNARFGANCFGKKPKPSSSDLAAIASSSGVQIPKSPEDLLLEKKIAFWNANREKLLKINSYNNNKWSMY
jgi:hypothetical protein